MKRANRIDREKDYLNICKRLVLRSYPLPRGLYWKFNGDIIRIGYRAEL